MNDRLPPSQPDESSTGSGLRAGRYRHEAARILEEINTSIDFDHRLAAQDIAGSIAHARMLAACSIISGDDANAIVEGLQVIDKEIQSGSFVFSRALEDIHMNIEGRLKVLIGEPAGRLHTARSRNDQVALDFKMWTRDAIDALDRQLAILIDAVIDKAEAHYADIMPGFTHLQCAQPITFGHHMMAYVEMLLRDRARLHDARIRLNECPLGAAALAGTSFPIDRNQTARSLGFDRPGRNSLDAVSDRDFAVEYLSACAMTGMHLSRLAEEIVIWSTSQFGFIQLPEELTSGSSIMPQKRNPDPAELVRAKSGRIFGSLQSLLVVMKGLPLAYFKDMQEDKESVFDTDSNISLCVRATTAMIAGMKVNTDAMHKAARSGFSTATDLADWLTRELAMPFRDAHRIVGKIVTKAEQNGKELDQLTLEEMQAIEPGITTGALEVLSVERSVSSRTSFGGTAPSCVLAAIKEARSANAIPAEAARTI